MRIALLEIPAGWDRRDKVVSMVRSLLDKGPPPTLTVLPETIWSGYLSPQGDFDLRPFAEPLAGPTAELAAELATRYQTTLVAPLIEEHDGHHYNAIIVVSPAGNVIGHYRKRHPWVPEEWATPGVEPLLELEIAGVRTAFAICYDVHFLERESADALGRSDVLVFPSAWVDSTANRCLRAPIFERLSKRFDLVIANANWGPGAPRLPGQGSSRFHGPGGELARVAGGSGGAARLDWVIEVGGR